MAVVYAADGSVDIDAEFDENVESLSRTDFDLKRLHGDAITDFDYFLTGEDAAYCLTYVPTSRRTGLLQVEFTGSVLRSGVSVPNVEMNPVLGVYNSQTPQVIDYESPPELSEGIFDVRWDLDYPEWGFDADDGFLYEGDMLSGSDMIPPPLIYKARSLDVRPETPPAPIDYDTPPDCVGDWVRMRPNVNQIPAKYILLRFNIPEDVSGSLNVYPKPDVLKAVPVDLV